MSQTTSASVPSTTAAAGAPLLPVRHSYPLQVRSPSLATAIGLLLRTLPYALVRFGILLAYTIGTIVWFSITFGGGAWLGTHIAEAVGFVWIIAGLVAFGYLWYAILRYFLHVVECGHVAVLTELITKGSVGSGGEGMFAHGRQVVAAKFAQINVLFGLNALVRGVVGTFNRTLDFVGELIPIPGLESLAHLVNAVLRAATRYIDKVIFSYNLARGDENPWRSSQDGLIYYCQNAREMLKTSVWIVILDKILLVVVWFVLLAPSALVALALPSTLRNFGTIVYLVIAALFASNVRQAFIKPLFLIMIMVKFHAAIENQPINEAWDARLTELSSKFVKLKEEAGRWVAPPPSAAPHPAS
jgi:hypothetical protein